MKSVNPENIAAPFGRYSHGIEVPPGCRFLRTSGQLGLSHNGEVPESVAAQAAICFANIDEILLAAGMTRRDIIHISAFVTNRGFMTDYMKVRDDYLEDIEILPTSTLLIVSGFTRPEFKVEIEVMAATQALDGAVT